MREIIEQVCKAFCIHGSLQSYRELKQGNINHTYKVDFRREDGSDKSYIVQRINTEVFRNPEQVMENIDRITEHIRSHYPTRPVLHFHHTADRKVYYYRGKEFWRLFTYFPSKSYDTTDDLEIVGNTGRIFGEFQMMLGDFNASLLYTTIPDFHDTTRRYDTLMAHVQDDPLNRVQEIWPELEWLVSVRHKACLLTEMGRRGELPLRVTHNDTKTNNVLFQPEGKDAIVVIDLDTVMPGLVGHDFGDAIRFAANKVAEDFPESDKAGLNMEIFRAFSTGFLSQTAATLTKNELNTLALSCLSMTCELATRFMDDYITGDTYFKTTHPGHNLERTRCQVALAQDIDRHLDEMDRIVQDCARLYR